MSNLISDNLFEKIAVLLKNARNRVVTTVNQTIVLTYFEIGRRIVEEEQQGKERADYGKHLLKNISEKLTSDFGKGFLVENLDRIRYFYKIYASRISSTVSTKSGQTQEWANGFEVNWSHYLKLMRINDENERQFYEIESIKNNWSLRELQRQFEDLHL